MKEGLMDLVETWKADGSMIAEYYVEKLEELMEWPAPIQYFAIDALRSTMLEQKNLLAERGMIDFGDMLVEAPEEVRQRGVALFTLLLNGVDHLLQDDCRERYGCGTCQLCDKEFIRHEADQALCSVCWINTHIDEVNRYLPGEKSPRPYGQSHPELN